MTDDQIEKWENKIKDSLLRRDTSLGTLINIFRNITSQTVMVDDTKYSLASFGITTKNYSEKGILYISGDEDMSASAYSDNKLKEAISNDPDTVMQVFTTLASNLYKSLSDQMKSTSLSSALTVYNDKELDKTLRNYKTQLSDLEDRLDKMEERYYQQFSAMESALEKLNAQSSYLSALLGTNNK
jgi:Flagellar hook-associated protein 2 C-terminus.